LLRLLFLRDRAMPADPRGQILLLEFCTRETGSPNI
jgi:hypothetical protein